MKAIRVVPGYVFPELVLPASRVVPVVEEPSLEEKARDAVAYLWQQAQLKGESEEWFRTLLRELGAFADRELPDFEPSRGVTATEAAALLEQGFAKAVA